VHLSVYDLQIEQGTVFGNWYDRDDDERSHAKTSTFQSTRGETPNRPIQRQQQVLRLPSADEAAFMYKYTSGYLRSKGFEHYEVSSYALQTGNPLTSHRSQHNQIYWDLDGQWYAVGLGATSFVNGRITERPRTLADYQRWVDRLDHNPNDDDDETGSSLVCELDFLMDHVLKRLRTSEGLSLDWILERFGSPSRNAIVKGAELGMDLHLAFIDESNRLRLKDPDGFLYSNSIISSIFVELENVLQ
jgi:oxygen-independent coproporphyrinogen-3 oxidase